MGLNQNTNKLQEILETVNSLPTANQGSGAPQLQSKTAVPSTVDQTIMADTEYDGLDTVIVKGVTLDATASNMLSGTSAKIKSNDTTISTVNGTILPRTNSDLIVSGSTVTVTAGYYATPTSISVSTMTLPTNTSTSASGSSKATITASTTDKYINIPVGYNSAAGYYKISAIPEYDGSVTSVSSGG